MKESHSIKDQFLLNLKDEEISQNSGKKTQRYIFDHGVRFNEYEE